MEDPKVRKLREKLGISAKDEQKAAGKTIGPNLRKRIPTDPRSGGNFISAPAEGGNFLSSIRT